MDQSRDIDREADFSFGQVQQWIAVVFKDEMRAEEEIKKKIPSWAEVQTQISSSKRQPTYLPWSPGLEGALTQIQDVVTPESSATSSLKLGKYLPSTAPGSLRYYRIRGAENPAEAAVCNPDLAALSTSAKLPKPVFDAQDEAWKAVETAARRQMMVSSALDWQCATAVRVAREMAEMPSKDPTQDLAALRRVHLSMARSVTQIHSENAHLLANTVMRRREAYLKPMTHLTDATRSTLRSKGIFSKTLFSEEQLKKSTEKVQQESSISTSIQILERLKRPEKKTSFATDNRKDWNRPAKRSQFQQRSRQKESKQSTSASTPAQHKYQARNSFKAPPKGDRSGAQRRK